MGFICIDDLASSVHTSRADRPPACSYLSVANLPPIALDRTMVSITIRTPPMSTSASLHQASIYSTYSHSHSNSHPYAYASLNNSCERLIPAKKHVLPKSNLRYSGPRTTTVQGQGKGRQVRTRRMASGGNSAAVEIEQKKSYGIGGAGNIRLSPLPLCSPTCAIR